MNYSKLNSALSNLDPYYLEKDVKIIERKQEEENTCSFVIDPETGDGTFVKLVYAKDSYGDNEVLVSMSFVKGVAKTVTVYEYIK